jgi:large subunit ribosomal protein L29
MDAEKIRNLTGDELLLQQRDLNDQLFRLKFQLKMGQTESLKKIRGLRKDVARIKTIMREKELGIVHKSAPAVAQAPAAAPAKTEKKAAAKPAAKKAAAKPAKKSAKAASSKKGKK